MPHFFIPPENIKNRAFTLAGDEARHLVKVLRCKPGDAVELFDGTGKCYAAKIDSVGKDAVSGVILSEKQSNAVRAVITLYNAVPKGDRFDWLIEKAAELGIAKVVPLITGRSVMKEISAAKIARWNRISMAASKQCGRPDVMPVTEAADFQGAAGSVPDTALNIIPWESENNVLLSSLSESARNRKQINIFIGPEGGFTLEEIETAAARGIKAVSLGPRILRAETAGLAASVIVLYMAGELESKQA